MKSRITSISPAIAGVAGVAAVLALAGCASAPQASSARTTASEQVAPDSTTEYASAQRVEAQQQCYSMTDALWLSTRDFNTAPITITGMGNFEVTPAGECRVEVLNVDHYLTVTVTYDDFNHALVLTNQKGRVVVPMRG